MFYNTACRQKASAVTWRRVYPDSLLVGSRLGLIEHVVEKESANLQRQGVVSPLEIFWITG